MDIKVYIRCPDADLRMAAAEAIEDAVRSFCKHQTANADLLIEAPARVMAGPTASEDETLMQLQYRQELVVTDLLTRPY